MAKTGRKRAGFAMTKSPCQTKAFKREIWRKSMVKTITRNHTGSGIIVLYFLHFCNQVGKVD